MKELVETMARALVDHPEQVDVSTEGDETTTILKLRVAPADLGRVIGKQGRNAKAMRTLLQASAAKAKRRALLEILEA